MAIYSYVALRDNRETIKGKIEANDLRSARAAIKQLKLLPVKVFEEAKADVVPVLDTVKLRKLSLKEKIDFSQTYQTLAAAGVPVVEGLMFMETDAASQNIRKVARELRRNIIAGSTFAETVKRYSHIFGQIFVGLTKAGEDSGEIEATMGRIIDLLKKQQVIKQKVVGALMYPMFVIVLAFVVSIIMLTFVFPKFSELFEQTGKQLPFFTDICLKAGFFLNDYWYAAILMFVALGMGIFYLFKWEVSRRYIDIISLRIPLIGDLLKYGGFSNYLSVFQVSYDAGVPIVNSLSLAELTIENMLIKETMEQAKIKVQQGLHLSSAFKATKIMPKILLFMISTGEQAGKLGEMLEQAVRFVDGELDNFVDKITRAIEPCMLVVLGGIVLFFALALYLPLFDMMIPS